MTYSAPIFARARFMNRNTGEIKEQTVFMGDFPMMTEKGTFIINGTERVVVSQLVRSPGVIFEPGERFRLRNLSKHQLVKGTVHPYRGEWLEFDVEQKPGKDVTAGTPRRPQAADGHLHPAARPRLRRGPRPRLPGALRRPLRLPRGPVGEGAPRRPHPERGAGRDLQARPPGRAADRRVGQGLLPQRVLRGPPLRPVARRPLQARPQAGRRGRQARRAVRSRHHRDGQLLQDRQRRPDEADDRQRSRRRRRAAPQRGRRRHQLHAPPRQAGARLPPRRPGPLRQPAHPQRRRADPEPGAHRSQPHGARRARADDHPGRRGHHPDHAGQHPPGRRGHQGVLRHLAAVAVHGPGQPAVGRHPPPPPVGARAGWSVPRACRLRGSRRALQPLRPDVPDRDAGGPEHRSDRCAVDVRPGQPVRLHRDAVPGRRERPGHRRDPLHGRRRGGELRRRPGQHRRSTPTAR